MPDNTEQTPDYIDYPRRIGILYESYIAVLFRLLGWDIEMTKQTNDLGADLLVYNPDDPDGKPHYAVQCKYWSQPVDTSAVQQIYSATRYYKAITPIIVSNQNVTTPAQEFADALGVAIYQVDAADWGEDLPLPKPELPNINTPIETKPSFIDRLLGIKVGDR